MKRSMLPQKMSERIMYVLSIVFEDPMLIRISVSTSDGQLVLGCAKVRSTFPCLCQLLTLYSTGKRRYGHPALNGVLPQPWLPLKKGQSMSNGRGAPDSTGEVKETVVLTLRKRYSRARPPLANGSQQRQFSSTERTPARDIPNPTVHEVSENPWQDPSPCPSRRPETHHQLNHRLSFDAATGVIMLPDDEGDWIAEEESDSDQDHGTPRGQGELVQQGDLQENWSAEDPTNVTQSPTKRYTTYYHHPERRKRT